MLNRRVNDGPEKVSNIGYRGGLNANTSSAKNRVLLAVINAVMSVASRILSPEDVNKLYLALMEKFFDSAANPTIVPVEKKAVVGARGGQQASSGLGDLFIADAEDDRYVGAETVIVKRDGNQGSDFS
jgi:hypothetical protein